MAIPVVLTLDRANGRLIYSFPMKNGRDVVQHGDHRHCVSYKELCSNTCRVWRQPMRDGRSVDWAGVAAAAAKTPAVGRTGETHCRTRIASQICCDISQIHLCFVSCTEKLQTQLLMNPNCCLLQLFSLALSLIHISEPTRPY